MVEIHQASVGDSPEIVACTNAAYAKYIPLLGRKPQPMTADYDEFVASQRVWVAHAAGDFAGLIVLLPEDAHLLIYSIAILPLHQGRGVGQRLMHFAEEEAIRQGYNRLLLYTNELMVENIAFYEWLGYEKTGRMPISNYRVLYMQKLLPASQS